MPLTPSDAARLRSHLVAARLAGDVRTSPDATRTNCGRLLDGDVDFTFGLTDWRDADRSDVLGAVALVCGEEAAARDGAGEGWIDPDLAAAAVERHHDRLAGFVAAGGGRVLLATGHPTGLLAHYGAIAAALRGAGCEVLRPLDDRRRLTDQDGRALGIRFVGGVGCASTGADLVHTHRSHLAEVMLDDLDGAGRLPDLVVADHGYAGAAIERGLPTLSIADVNDPALMLAQARGRTDAVLPIDDNLPPYLFEAVTAVVLGELAPAAIADLAPTARR